MSKSIRSKWKRKCRAVKRERYAVKELARLNKMLGINEDNVKAVGAEVMETSEQVIFLDAGKMKENAKKIALKEASDAEMSSDDEKVEVPGDDGTTRVFDTKTLKDENGQYPVWLHKRKIAKMTKSVKKNLKKKAKRRRK